MKKRKRKNVMDHDYCFRYLASPRFMDLHDRQKQRREEREFWMIHDKKMKIHDEEMKKLKSGLSKNGA